jgi:Bacterial SH3 domain
MIFGKTVTSAGVLLVLSAVSAAAAPALAVNNVNLRQGPGTTYTVIMTIPGGSNVDVGDCNGQWCQVTFEGQNGYAIATSLDQGGGAPPPGAGAAGPPPAGYAGPPPAGYAAAPPPGYAGPPPGVDPDAPIPVSPIEPPPVGPPIYVGPPPPAYYFYGYGYGPYYGPYGRGYYYRRW